MMERNINDSLNDLTQSLFDFVCPKSCPFCGKKIAKRLMCTDCEETLPYCEEIREAEGYRRCTAPVYLEGSAEKALYNYIHRGAVENMNCLGALMAECAQKRYQDQFDLISFVPSNKKERRKTHEAPRFLCASLCVDWHVMPVETLIKKDSDYEPVNLDQWRDKRILMIYDTMDEEIMQNCTKVLMESGAKDVMWQVFGIKR